uniref:Uncharacterized protein n=1 Tax=Salvator merianae TaxID=96440 RepID=A0A8D0DVY3_SALMN
EGLAPLVHGSSSLQKPPPCPPGGRQREEKTKSASPVLVLRVQNDEKRCEWRRLGSIHPPRPGAGLFLRAPAGGEGLPLAEAVGRVAA